MFIISFPGTFCRSFLHKNIAIEIHVRRYIELRYLCIAQILKSLKWVYIIVDSLPGTDIGDQDDCNARERKSYANISNYFQWKVSFNWSNGLSKNNIVYNIIYIYNIIQYINTLSNMHNCPNLPE